MNVVPFIVSHAQSATLVKPTVGPLHGPAVAAQAAAVRRPAPGQARANSACPQGPTVRLGIVGAVGIYRVRAMARTARLAINGRNGIDQRNQLRDVVTVRPGDGRRQWDAAGVGDEMMLGAGFATVGRIRPGFRPPKTARTLLLSMRARDQSIWSASFRRSNKTRWIVSHTPAAVQSRKRRQHVMPQPQPISRGRSSQPMPVRSTKRMPVIAGRLPIGLRPGYRKRRGGSSGINGSITSHSSSVRIGLAMLLPPCKRLAANIPFASQIYLRQQHSPIFHFVRGSKF